MVLQFVYSYEKAELESLRFIPAPEPLESLTVIGMTRYLDRIIRIMDNQSLVCNSLNSNDI